MIAALYVDAASPLHRMRAGYKLVALPILAAGLFAAGNPALIAFGLALVLALYAAARIPLAVLAAQVKTVAPVLALLFLVQLWLAGAEVASVTALRFVALILGASLITLTTRTGAMIAALEGALSKLALLGVDAAKVSLAISLVLRFVPVIGEVFQEVREAQAARGQSRSLFALAVPVIVRTLKMADEIAEAIDARS